MPRTRAYRRHQRQVKLARRRRIVKQGAVWQVFGPHPIPPQAMHWHFRCNCFADPREHGAGRRREEERAWRQREGV